MLIKNTNRNKQLSPLKKGFHSILIRQKYGCHGWFFFLIGKYTKIIFSSVNWNQSLQEWCLEDPL
jgi:hypothetical protein